MSFLTLKKPDHEYLERFVRAQRTLLVTYPVQSGKLTPTPGFGHTGFRHAGFRHTEMLEPLGSGRAVFERAVAGLEAWAVYPAWMTLYPHHAPICEGEGVALVTGFAPVWTVSAVRIVAVERAARRFSFTLGTPRNTRSRGRSVSASCGPTTTACGTGSRRSRGPGTRLPNSARRFYGSCRHALLWIRCGRCGVLSVTPRPHAPQTNRFNSRLLFHSTLQFNDVTPSPRY